MRRLKSLTELNFPYGNFICNYVLRRKSYGVLLRKQSLTQDIIYTLIQEEKDASSERNFIAKRMIISSVTLSFLENYSNA